MNNEQCLTFTIRSLLVSLHTFIHTHTRVCTHTHIHGTQVHACIYTYINSYIHESIRDYTHTYIRAYTYIYIYYIIFILYIVNIMRITMSSNLPKMKYNDLRRWFTYAQQLIFDRLHKLQGRVYNYYKKRITIYF